MNAFIPLGVLALIVGGAMLVTGIRRHKAQHPKHVAMLIAGMMMTAFGLFLAGFAIAWQNTPPLNLGAAR
jgi:Ca2+/H+ antiporter